MHFTTFRAQRRNEMTKAKRAWIILACCLSVLASSACSRFGSETTAEPVDVVFDAPIEEIEGGVRLALPENNWDGYGKAVDVRGDVLVIGAPESNYAWDGRGAAYVYRFLDGEWQEEARLVASDRDDGQSGQRFGNPVTLGDGILAIGAPGADDPQAGENSGAVYIFEYNGQTWVETTKLMPDRQDRDDTYTEMDWSDYSRMRPMSFGALVALDGDTLAVGVDSAENSGTNSVYIYQRGETGWQEQARIRIPGSRGRELYLGFMALFGDALALSALYLPPQPEQTPLITGNVTVYVFERTRNSWKESFRFIPEGSEDDFIFLAEVNIGASVALGGTGGQANLLAVGLPGFPDWSGDLDVSLVGANPDTPEFPASYHQTGTVYLFERTEDGDWNQKVSLKSAGWEPPPGPGSSIAGVPSAADGEQDDFDEAAYFASRVFPGDVFSENPEISFFGATVDLDGDQLAVTAGFANATYVFERRGQDWVYRFGVTPSRVAEGMWEDFAQVVAISDRTLLLGTPGEFGDSAYVFSLLPAEER